MTNTNRHQSGRSIFSSQSDTSFEQHSPTLTPVVAVPAANIPSPAGDPHRLPLDADNLDISRDPPGPPAQSKVTRPPQSTHQSLPDLNGEHLLHDCRVVTLVHFRLNIQSEYRTYAPRPDTGTSTQTSGSPSAGEAPVDPDNPQGSEGLPQRPRCGVWQDKARFLSARAASRQPARMTEVTRAEYPNNPVVRSQTDNSARQKLVPVTLWVDQALKDHLKRLARTEQLSISAAGAAFMRKSYQQHIDLEYSALLEPVFERLIAKHMRGISTRLAWLLVRVSIDSGQTRSLVTNILGRQTGMTTDLLRSIVKQSADTARGNITRKTPQIEDLVESVEKWLNTREGGENN